MTKGRAVNSPDNERPRADRSGWLALLGLAVLIWVVVSTLIWTGVPVPAMFILLAPLCSIL